MYLRFSTPQYEMFLNSLDIESFGKFERDNMCVPQAVPSGVQGTFKLTMSTTPKWEYWIQIKNRGNGGEGRVNCTEEEYRQVVELLAPGGAELYDELRQSRNNANPNCRCNDSVAKLAVPTGEAQAKDPSSGV